MQQLRANPYDFIKKLWDVREPTTKTEMGSTIAAQTYGLVDDNKTTATVAQTVAREPPNSKAFTATETNGEPKSYCAARKYTSAGSIQSLKQPKPTIQRHLNTSKNSH